ncbi:MAG: hypothetical protein ACKPE3_19025 [Sphaerospermopsis kisseleviana]
MSEPKTKPYKVKPGKLVIHGGDRYTEGMEIELTDAVAEVHGQNLEPLEPEAEEETEPGTEGDAEPKQKTRTPKTSTVTQANAD